RMGVGVHTPGRCNRVDDFPGSERGVVRVDLAVGDRDDLTLAAYAVGKNGPVRGVVVLWVVTLNDPSRLIICEQFQAEGHENGENGEACVGEATMETHPGAHHFLLSWSTGRPTMFLRISHLYILGTMAPVPKIFR